MTDTKKFWQWLVERAKKVKIAAKSPTDLDKWINGLLAEIDDMDNWENDNWWYNKFGVGKMGSKEILKLNEHYEGIEDKKEKPDEVNECAVLFLEELYRWKQDVEEKNLKEGDVIVNWGDD